MEIKGTPGIQDFVLITGREDRTEDGVKTSVFQYSLNGEKKEFKVKKGDDPNPLVKVSLDPGDLFIVVTDTDLLGPEGSKVKWDLLLSGNRDLKKSDDDESPRKGIEYRIMPGAKLENVAVRGSNLDDRFLLGSMVPADQPPSKGVTIRGTLDINFFAGRDRLIAANLKRKDLRGECFMNQHGF